MKLTTIVASSALLVSGAAAQSCPEAIFLFARGTTETGDLGSTVGPNMRSALRTANRNIQVVGIQYPASSAFEESAAQGATWAVNYVKDKAAACPETKFAFGGYSQGCQVVHKVRAGLDAQEYQDRIIGATLWGDPYMMGAGTLSRIPKSWAGKIMDNCARGDPVCGGGSNFLAHITGYMGSYRSAARFLNDRLSGKAGNPTPYVHGNDKNLPDTTPSTPVWG